MQTMQNLAINPQRLWDSLMETARIGGTAKGGICRLTLTDLDRQVRDWFVDACRKAGCEVSVDDVGNIFARRPGRNPDLLVAQAADAGYDLSGVRATLDALAAGK